MAQSNASNRRTPPGTAGTRRTLVVDGLATCTIHAADDGTWHVVAQLASDDQAALAAAAPTADDLCRRAQHALGLAGIGSRIYRDRSAIGVYAIPIGAQGGEATLFFDGREVLWFVAHAAPNAIRTLLQAATHAIHQSPSL